MFTHGPRATSYANYVKKANGMYGTAWLMPVFHVLPGLRRDAAVTVVLFVEGGVQMVDNYPKVALQGVVVDRALPVPVNAIVYVSDGCIDRPVRDMHCRVIDDLAYDLRLEGATVSENPVGLIARHCCPMPVLLFHHLLNDLSPVLVAR